jgi:hypothetical protein
MIIFELGEQSVDVVITVPHEGHSPVTGSIELHPSIITPLGPELFTTTVVCCCCIICGAGCW